MIKIRKSLIALSAAAIIASSTPVDVVDQAVADLPSTFHYTLAASVDGSRSTKYPGGNKPPTSGTLSCDLNNWQANFPNLVGLIVGTPFSHDITTYFSGSGLGTATFTIVSVTGAAGWSISANQNLVNAGSSTGSGSFKVRGSTSGGEDVDCPTVGWLYEADPGTVTDTTAPTIPTGFEHVANVGNVVVSVDSPNDPIIDGDLATHSHVDKIQFRFNGGTPVDVDVPGEDLSLSLTKTQIGGGTGSVVQNGNGYTITDEGTGFDGAGGDQFTFLHAPLTGDGYATITVDSLSGGNSFSKIGLHGRIDNIQGARYWGWYYQESGASDKYQLKHRQVTNGSTSIAVNKVTTLPATFHVRKTGDVYKVYLSTNSGLTWSEEGEVSCVDCPTMQWGIALTSQGTGATATAVVSQWNLNNAPRLSYQHTTSSAVTVEARSFDNDGNISNWSGQYTATPIEEAPPSAIKWHPGHYLLADNGSSLSGKIGYCNEARNNSGLKGIQVRFMWYQLEGAQGDYTDGFDLIDQLLAACSDGDTLPKKRLMLEVWWRSFGSGGSSTLLPPYLVNLGGTNNLVQTDNSNGGWIGAVWRTHVADRAIALMQAYGARYDSHPYFEMIATKETAVGPDVDTNSGDYTSTAFLTQYKRILTAARAAFPSTNVRIFANYLTNGTNPQMIELIEHAKAEKICWGGPDMSSTKGTLNATQAQAAAEGTLSGTAGHDYRDEMCIAYNVEQHNLGGANQTMSLVNGWANDPRKANYRPWMRCTWAACEPLTWSPDILPYLNANPNTITTCPSTFTCNTN